MVDLKKEKPVVLYLLYSEFPEDNSGIVISKMVVTNPETMPCDLTLTLISRFEIFFKLFETFGENPLFWRWTIQDQERITALDLNHLKYICMKIFWSQINTFTFSLIDTSIILLNY